MGDFQVEGGCYGGGGQRQKDSESAAEETRKQEPLAGLPRPGRALACQRVVFNDPFPLLAGPAAGRRRTTICTDGAARLTGRHQRFC